MRPRTTVQARAHGLKGSIGRRGNTYDNAKAESFMKTLKGEKFYLMEYETRRRRGLIAALHRRGLQQQALHSALGCSPVKFEQEHARPMGKSAA